VQMKTLAIFQNAGWSQYAWVIQDGQGYPTLPWQNAPGVPIPPAPPLPLTGSGAPADPYQISTPADFALLSWYVSVLDKHFVLLADLNLAPYTLCPIGDLGPFTGVFDGNNHVIRNPLINQPAGSYIGLFACLGAGGQLRNLTLANGNMTGGFCVGGLVGHNTGTISACYATGPVMGTRSLGGLVGINAGAISACYATGPVNGGSTVGGLVGYNSSGTITASYATGRVIGSLDVGGLVGSSDYSSTITASHATGPVYGSASRVGGLVGSTDHSSTITASYSTGVVDGEDCVGGLVGENWSGTITACYSTGVVFGENCVGGLVGDKWSGTISTCYATGGVCGSSGVGGLVGYSFSGAISACYATGAVSGSSDVGGLVGSKFNKGTIITTSFWDTQTSGQSSSAGGTGKTTAQMKTQSTFTAAAWDFTTPVWTICEGIDYPRLAWQHLACSYGGGAGTPADPYLIATAEQMQAVGAWPVHWSKHFRLLADIDLAAYDGQSGRPAFNIIGNDSTNFSGAFDGNGHAISRFTCTSTGRDHVGIFGDVSGPNVQIKNLTLIEPTVNGGLGHGVAALVGALYSGAVTACTVLGGAIQTDFNAGGLVGYNGGAISDSCSSARVQSNTHTGGLVGFSDGQILRSYASGIVVGSVNVGGLLGYNRNPAAIANCYAAGPVSGSDYVGGLLGYNQSTAVSNCYASGPVSGASNVGGLVGYSSSGTISACFWDKDTSGQTSSAGGTPKTTAQMKTRSTFTAAPANWDFLGESNGANTWRMCLDGVSYPLLTWQFVRGGDFACPDGVNLDDLARLVQDWLTIPPQPFFGADANGDSLIDLRDFALLNTNWLK